MKDIFTQIKSWPRQDDVLRADTALVIVDVQYLFCSMPNNRLPTVQALQKIRMLRDLCDAHSLPSLYVYLTVKGGMEDKFVMPKDTEELYRQRLSGAFDMAQKDYTSAFEHQNMRNHKPTRFMRLLADYPNVKRLVFTGVNTSVCVSASARDAVRYGYESVVLADACANVCDFSHGRYAQDEHDSTLRTLAGHHKVQISDFKKFRHHLQTGRPLRLRMDARIADVPVGLTA